MKSLYNKGLQDIFIIFALLAVNIILFNNVYASTDTDEDYITNLTASVLNPNNAYTEEQYVDSLVQAVNNPKAYTEEDYVNSLVSSIYGNEKPVTSTKPNKLEVPTTMLTDEKLIFSYTHGLRVINKNEIRKVIKSAKMGASIIASPALLEFAKINGIESVGRVLPNKSVKKISIYIKRFMSDDKTPEMLVFVRKGSHNVKTSLARMITNKATLSQFIDQYNFELVFPGMLMDFTPVVGKAVENIQLTNKILNS